MKTKICNISKKTAYMIINVNLILFCLQITLMIADKDLQKLADDFNTVFKRKNVKVNGSKR